MGRTIVRHKEILASVVFVERQRLQLFYAPTNQVLSMAVSEDAVKDLEVDNEKALERQLSTWLAPLKLEAEKVFVVLAEDMYFVHDSKSVEIAPDSAEYTEFMELVPFDEPIVVPFPMATGSRTVAVSHDLLTPIERILTDQGFKVLSVTPSFALTRATQSENLTPEEGMEIARQRTQLLLYNLLPKEKAEAALRGDEDFLSVTIDRKLILMVTVFVLLLLALGILLWTQRTPKSLVTAPEQVEVVPAAPPTVATPVATPPQPSLLPAPATESAVVITATEETAVLRALTRELEASEYFQARFLVSTTAATQSRVVVPSALTETARQVLLDSIAAADITAPFVEDATASAVTVFVAE